LRISSRMSCSTIRSRPIRPFPSENG
jgi:hypothetical protein